MSWKKLNYLVPEPQCRTESGIVTEWRDARPQPSQGEIDAVTDAQVLDQEAETQLDNDSYPDITIQTLKGMHLMFNKIRVLEGKSTVTRRVFRETIKNLP
jgi:hypothetical protein